MSTLPPSERMYEKAWRLLRSATAYNPDSNSQTSEIRAEVSKSQTSEVVKKHATTFTRGVQKEKYNDIPFRRMYPQAKLKSVLDEASGVVTIYLELNGTTNLADL